jgi:hypothetical protein
MESPSIPAGTGQQPAQAGYGVLEIKKERKKKMMDPAGIFCRDRIMEHLLCMGKK